MQCKVVGQVNMLDAMQGWRVDSTLLFAATQVNAAMLMS
jgi:hypothetical protein